MSRWDELEKAAKESTPGRVYDRLDSAGGGIKYHCYGSDGSIVLQVDHKNDEFGFIGPRGEQDEAFFLACTPETVLTLIEQNRELLEALREIHNEVEGNIEPTVRDLVNQCGRNTPTDPNEIYGYCERIEEIIRKATGEEA